MRVGDRVIWREEEWVVYAVRGRLVNIVRSGYWEGVIHQTRIPAKACELVEDDEAPQPEQGGLFDE